MIYLNTDHSGMNKFSGADDGNLALILPELHQMVEDGASIVANRHCAQDRSMMSKESVSTGKSIDTGDMFNVNVHWMVPRAVNSLFTGRKDLLLRMQKSLHLDPESVIKKQRRFVVTGLGGQGKSEVCLQLASLMREE